MANFTSPYRNPGVPSQQPTVLPKAREERSFWPNLYQARVINRWLPEDWHLLGTRELPRHWNAPARWHATAVADDGCSADCGGHLWHEGFGPDPEAALRSLCAALGHCQRHH